MLYNKRGVYIICIVLTNLCTQEMHNIRYEYDTTPKFLINPIHAFYSSFL